MGFNAKTLRSNYLTRISRDFKKVLLDPIQDKNPIVDDDLILKFLFYVASTPNQTAIITTSTSMTYHELYLDVLYWNKLLNQYIDKRVIICIDRTPRLLSILLALNWLGITYIPVDQSIPIERLRYIIKDSNAACFLHDMQETSDYTSLPCTSITLSDIESNYKAMKDTSQPYTINPNATAYIIYTSGSTGNPKGVIVSRLALNNFLSSMSMNFLNEENAILLAITTIAFDISVLELYLPLWQNKALFMANQNQYKDPMSIVTILNEYPITLLQTTPSVWSTLRSMEWKISSRLVALCGGEPLKQSLATHLLKDVAELWNMFGPTEATVWCSCKRILPQEPITIGYPIRNMEMRVMNQSHQQLAPYVKGELYIGGVGLADGYINNQELTNKQFIVCDDVVNGRLYRSGDIACTTFSGEFMIFGRIDNQIKLHGFRIELEEIEAQIQTLPNIRECAVIVYKEQLVAYICPLDPQLFSEKDLIVYLSMHLPEYMLPKQVVCLDYLPISASGKVDRKSLPSPKRVSPAYIPDQNGLSETELFLTKIWASELSLPTIGLHDDFFKLGGHSLMAARIMFKISKQMQKQINVNELYKAPTIKEFSDVVERAHVVNSLNEIKSKSIKSKHGWLPLNDFQCMLWIAEIFEPKLKKFNIVARKRLQGPLNKKALDLALQFVFKQHETLSYTFNRFYPAQKTCKKTSVHWIEKSLVDYDKHNIESYLLNALNELFFKQKWRTQMPLLIAKLFYLQNDQVEIHICMPHLVSDDASVAIFFEDLSNAYLHYAEHAPLHIKKSHHDYLNFILSANHTISKNADVDVNFWENYLQDAGLFAFPKKYISKSVTRKPLLSSLHLEIPESLLVKLQDFCVNNRFTLNDVMAAAIAIALLNCCDNEDILPHKLVMNIVKSTRDDPYYDHLIGCFLHINPIKIDLNKELTLIDLSKQARQSTVETSEHQRAASLVKLSSIGQLTSRKKSVRTFLRSLTVMIMSHLCKRINFDKSLITACFNLASMEHKHNILININILNDFYLDANHKNKKPLFGIPNLKTPLHNYPIHAIEPVLDLCFHRNNDQQKPFIIISSKLTPEFHDRFGKTLLDILHKGIIME